MDFETFRGRDVKEALAMVRAAYGADAIIAGTRVVTNGRDGGLSQSYVEVKAAPSIPPPHTSQRAFPYAREAADRARSIGDKARTTRPIGSSPSSPAKMPSLSAPKMPSNLMPPKMPSIAPDADRTNAVETEVRALRELVERMLAAKKPKERIAAALANTGLEGKLASELGAGLGKTNAKNDEDSKDLVRDRLRERVVCREIALEAGATRMIACVGPTGSGKTTTLAKLAAHAHLEKSLRVHIVTLDTFRVGAVEQMRRFATLIGVPFTVSNDAQGIVDALATQPDLLLVDTPSRGPRDEAAMGRLAACLAAAGDTPQDVLLTIPAHMRTSDAEDLTRAYRKVKPTACVITKLDETERRGGAVGGAIAGKLDIAFYCNGPRVPEDLAQATPDAIATLVIPRTEPTK